MLSHSSLPGTAIYIIIFRTFSVKILPVMGGKKALVVKVPYSKFGGKER